MKVILFRQIGVVALGLLLTAGCARSPEEVAIETLQGWCQPGPQSIMDNLTTDSQRLLTGLLQLSPDLFQCGNTTAGEVMVTDTMQVEGGVKVVTLSAGGRQAQVALLHEEGEWRVDLFLTEAAHYGFPLGETR